MSDFKFAIQGMMLAVLGFSMFSIGDVFAKIMSDDFTVIQTAFWVNVMLMIAYVSLSHELGGLKQTFQSRKKHLHLIRGILGFTVFFMMINGFQKIGMAMSYTLIFSGPFIAAILSVFILKQKIGIHRWVSILLGFIGVLIVLRPGTMPIELAAVGVLLAALCFALSSIITRKIGNDEPTLSFAFYSALVSLTLFTILMVVFDGFATLPTIPQLTFFISVAFFHVGGTFAVTRAFKGHDTAIIAPFHYVQLIWGIFFGYILFEQTIDMWTAIGSGIIVASGIYLIYREKVRNAELNRGVTTHGAFD